MSSQRANLVSRRQALKLLGVGASAGLLAATVLPAAASPLVDRVLPAVARGAGPAIVVRQGISLPTPEKKSLTMAHSTLETSQLAYVMARDLGFYKKYGIDDFTMVLAEGDGKTIQTIVAGGADLSANGISGTISSQMTDVPLQTIVMTATTLTDDLVTAADIKTADDLRGKSIAISTFGSTAHASAVLCLKSIGLTQDDVTLVQVGGQAARVAAVKGGSVQGTVADIAIEEDMKAQGFNILTRLPDSPLEFGRNGGNVRKEWLAEAPNTVLALAAAILEGQNAIWTRTDEAVQAYMNWAQISDKARATNDIEAFKKYRNRDMRWSKEGWILARDILAVTNADVASVDVETAYTTGPLDQLESLGFQQSLNIPRSHT
jgi:NitT/TauT family transport system substrate-binding protein